MWKKAGSPEAKNNIYNIKRNETRRNIRSVQRQQVAIKRNTLHQEIMEASSRDKNLFFKLVKSQRATSAHSTQILRKDDKEYSTVEDIIAVFKNHFEQLAEPKNLPTFDEEHNNLVKADAELIINICENSYTTIQPVTLYEIDKIVKSLKKKKSCDTHNLKAEHLQYGGPVIADYLATVLNNIF